MKDEINFLNNWVVMNYAHTSENSKMVMLPLYTKPLSIYQSKENLIVGSTSEDQGTIVIEFSSEQLARNGFNLFYSKLKAHNRKIKVLRSIQAIIKWGFIPFLIFLFLLALNVAVTTKSSFNYQPNSSVILPSTPTLLDQKPVPLVKPQNSLIPNGSELAEALNDGVMSGRFSITLSSGNAGTLYIFTDPLCQYCKSLENELTNLQDYTINLIPVTVISGDAASNELSNILCRKPEERAAIWRDLMADRNIDQTPCSEGLSAIAANNEIFRAMKFPGTPTIINHAGIQLPDNIPNTADHIKNWMKGYK